MNPTSCIRALISFAFCLCCQAFQTKSSGASSPIIIQQVLRYVCRCFFLYSGRFRCNDVQIHSDMVIRQLERILKVPRLSGSECQCFGGRTVVLPNGSNIMARKRAEDALQQVRVLPMHFLCMRSKLASKGGRSVSGWSKFRLKHMQASRIVTQSQGYCLATSPPVTGEIEQWDYGSISETIELVQRAFLFASRGPDISCMTVVTRQNCIALVCRLVMATADPCDSRCSHW